MKVLHRYHDGAVLRVISSRDLVRLPVWKGQRIMDPARVCEMKRAIGTNVRRLDAGYHVVQYHEEAADGRRVASAYLVDATTPRRRDRRFLRVDGVRARL